VGSIDVFLQPKNQFHLSYERFFSTGISDTVTRSFCYRQVAIRIHTNTRHRRT
jgi:hypothetical protein